MPSLITILSPVPEPAASAAPSPSAPRPSGPVRVGALANGKPNSDRLLDGLLQVLAADPRFVLGPRLSKGSASIPAAPGDLKRLASDSDLVVTAVAD
jgi:hypothetical protein